MLQESESVFYQGEGLVLYQGVDGSFLAEGEAEWSPTKELLEVGDTIVPGAPVETPQYHWELFWPISGVVFCRRVRIWLAMVRWLVSHTALPLGQ